MDIRCPIGTHIYTLCSVPTQHHHCLDFCYDTAFVTFFYSLFPANTAWEVGWVQISYGAGAETCSWWDVCFFLSFCWSFNSPDGGHYSICISECSLRGFNRFIYSNQPKAAEKNAALVCSLWSQISLHYVCVCVWCVKPNITLGSIMLTYGLSLQMPG